MAIKHKKAEEIGVGVFVYHEKFGTGRVVDRWGPLVISRDGKSKAVLARCEDVFDVVFGKALHSCRKEFLRPGMTAQSVLNENRAGKRTEQRAI